MMQTRLSRRPARGAALVALFLILTSCLAAAAQGPDLVIPRALLRIWPEFDDPGLLVILSGDFADATGYPKDVTFPMPAGARNIQAAYPDASGSLLNADWRIDGNTVTYVQLPRPAFQLEYYVDRQPGGNQREITYVFEAPYAIQALDVKVQQPARATDFSLTPPAERTETDAYELTNHVFSRNQLAAGDQLEITLRYIKTDSGLSQPRLVVTAPTPVPDAATGTTGTSGASGSATTWLPWLLIGAGGVALVGLLAYWFLAQRRPAAPVVRSRAVAHPPAAPSARTTPPRAAAFCTQCGNALRPDDRFCAQCGAARKS